MIYLGLYLLLAKHAYKYNIIELHNIIGIW